MHDITFGSTRDHIMRYFSWRHNSWRRKYL